MPYFLSNSITEAITTDEQSVSGMKPIFTSFFSGRVGARGPGPGAHRVRHQRHDRDRAGLLEEVAAVGARLRSSGSFIACSESQKVKKAFEPRTSPSALERLRSVPA